MLQGVLTDANVADIANGYYLGDKRNQKARVSVCHAFLSLERGVRKLKAHVRLEEGVAKSIRKLTQGWKRVKICRFRAYILSG